MQQYQNAACRRSRLFETASLMQDCNVVAAVVFREDRISKQGPSYGSRKASDSSNGSTGPSRRGRSADGLGSKANAAVADQAAPRSYAALDLQHRGKILLACASCDFANGAGKRGRGIVTSPSRSPGPQAHSSWRYVKRALLHVPATSISASRELEYIYLSRFATCPKEEMCVPLQA